MYLKMPRERLIRNSYDYGSLALIPTAWLLLLAELATSADQWNGFMVTGCFLLFVAFTYVHVREWQQPNFIRTNEDGVEFGSWWERRFYRWSDIERFVVGNPASPRNAYLVLQYGTAHKAERAVHLPAMNRVAADDLVIFLNQILDTTRGQAAAH